jgi:hypothetical protein
MFVPYFAPQTNHVISKKTIQLQNVIMSAFGLMHSYFHLLFPVKVGGGGGKIWKKNCFFFTFGGK